MAGKNVKKGGPLPGFFEDYGVGVKGGGITVTHRPAGAEEIMRKYGNTGTGGKSAPKKPAGKKK